MWQSGTWDPINPNRTVVWLWHHILTLQVNAEVHQAITQLCFSPSSILCSRHNCSAWCSANWKVNYVFEVISCHSCKSDSSSSPWDQVHICLNGWGPTTGLLENIWSLKVPFMEYFLIKIKLKNSMQNLISAMNYCWKQSATQIIKHFITLIPPKVPPLAACWQLTNINENKLPQCIACGYFSHI